MSVFRLTMLPASEGDSLILSYGAKEDALRHLLIDGGRKATWPHLRKCLEAIAARGEDIELLLLSHIDADHIDGLLELVEAKNLPTNPKAVWYNGFDQLKSLSSPGGLQPQGFRAADAYSAALKKKGWPLNTAFAGNAIMVEGEPKPFNFAGLKMTVVSPNRAKLRKLWTDWEKWRNILPLGATAKAKRPMPAVLDVEALSGPSGADTTAPNGSSIALIVEYGGRSVLLGADAHPDVLLATLKSLAGTGGKVKIDLAKLPHHGSRANISREIIETLDCRRYAVSTSGAVFGHPDPEAVARILKFGDLGKKTIYFNYASERTLPWNDANQQARYNYTCVFPTAAGEPLVIDI